MYFSDFSSIRGVDVKNNIFRILLWTFAEKTKQNKTRENEIMVSWTKQKQQKRKLHTEYSEGPQ